MKFFCCLLIFSILNSCISIAPGGLGYDIGKAKVFKGEACRTVLFGFLSIGDNSINAAKKAGSLRRVAYFDTWLVNYYFWFVDCTIAYGEKSKNKQKNYDDFSSEDKD